MAISVAVENGLFSSLYYFMEMNFVSYNMPFRAPVSKQQNAQAIPMKPRISAAV